MKRNLNPLAVHIGLAVAEMARQTGGAVDVASADIKGMLLGVQKYQQYDGDVARPALQEVWRAGQVSVSCLAACDGAPLLMLPSMINRSSILNLTEDRSLMQYFADQGLCPYLLDWGESVQDDGQGDIDTLLQNRLLPALRYVRERHGAPVHVLGYCMGGLVAAALAVHGRGGVASVAFLATPWDFHAGVGALRQRVDFWMPTATSTMQQKGFLDQDWMQTVFASLDPAMTCDKFMKFAQAEAGSAEEALFIAIEDWLNEGVHLPLGIAQMCLQDWFVQNKPAGRAWRVMGKLIDPAAIDVPALVVASRKDRLVEYDCAKVLGDQLPQATMVEPDCGHIGMIAGRRAIDEAWQPMAAFFASCKAR